MSDLESIPPEQAVKMFHDAMLDEHAESTRRSEKHRLRAFLQFCDEEGIEDLTELSGRDLYLYRTWRRDGQGDGRESIKKVTLKGQLATLRRFLRFAADIDAVQAKLYEQVTLPTMTSGEDVSESTLSADRGIEILKYLERAQPGSRDHIIVLLLWKTGARTGAVRGLDLRDLDLDGTHRESTARRFTLSTVPKPERR